MQISRKCNKKCIPKLRIRNVPIGGVGAWGHGGVMPPPQFPGKFKKVGHVARNVACIGKLEQILICNLVYSAGHS